MRIKKIICLTIIVSIFASLIALPMNANAKARTIKEFEEEVEKYTKELEAKKNQVATNEQEIAQIKKKIANIENQIKAAELEIINLQKEIDASNLEIEQKSEESKRILEYYQISNGENAYLEYAFGATSITDMIYRISVIEQLTDYNDKIMKELEMLIEKNKKQQEELIKKQEDLENMKNSLIEEKMRLDADSAAIKAGMPGIEEQIKAARSQVEYYKKLKCGPTEDIQACQYRIEQENKNSALSIPSTNGFYRPVQHGYITQWYTGCKYYNPKTGTCTGHIGIDIGSSDKSIDVYPIAPGYVTATYYDNAGALVVKIKHNYNGRYIYSTYAHQRTFAVKAGQYVSAYTSIGKMGSTGNSSGPHVHLEITSCDWKSEGGGCSWRSYAESSTMNPASYVNFPSRWSNR